METAEKRIVTISNGRLPGGRFPTYWMVSPTGEVHLWQWKNIAGVAAIGGNRHVKNGRWTDDIFSVHLSEGAVYVDMTNGLHQRPLEEFVSRADLISRVQELAPMAAPEAIVRAAEMQWPKCFQELVERDIAIAELG